MTNFEKVLEFHDAFDLPIRIAPQADIPEARLRAKLIMEEFEEYLAALASQDIVAIADALADLLYVVYGAGLCHGIPMDLVFAEVHRSNMTKLGADGDPIFRGDGKILKGPNYEPPNLPKVMDL